ncbi:MAG: hypothetical protein ABSA92_06045 [Candidatus Bathyarchaeia archaeon]
MSEDYLVCRCGARFTNDETGKRLYDRHQDWCGKQGLTISQSGRTGKRAGKRSED